MEAGLKLKISNNTSEDGHNIGLCAVENNKSIHCYF